jgi:hypothetical protein
MRDEGGIISGFRVMEEKLTFAIVEGGKTDFFFENAAPFCFGLHLPTCFLYIYLFALANIVKILILNNSQFNNFVGLVYFLCGGSWLIF